MPKPLKSEKKVTSVWLAAEKDPKGEYILKLFRCFNCSVPVVQYQGDAIRVVPGYHPYTPKTVLKCKGNTKNENGVWEECGIYYCFMGVADTKKFKE